MRATEVRSCTLGINQEAEYIWRSPLLQAIATLRASGQIFCADACQELFTLLHTYDPTERSEAAIVSGLIAKAERSDQWAKMDKQVEQFVRCVEAACTSEDTGASGSASTAPSGQQRRSCCQAAPLGGGGSDVPRRREEEAPSGSLPSHGAPVQGRQNWLSQALRYWRLNRFRIAFFLSGSLAFRIRF